MFPNLTGLPVYDNIHFLDKIYVRVPDGYPQNKNVGVYCPSGYEYHRHACGDGSMEWRGSGMVQNGPFSIDEYLDSSLLSGSCIVCDCNSVTVECILGKIANIIE